MVKYIIQVLGEPFFNDRLIIPHDVLGEPFFNDRLIIPHDVLGEPFFNDRLIIPNDVSYNVTSGMCVYLGTHTHIHTHTIYER